MTNKPLPQLASHNALIFNLPVPPKELRPNSRVHYMQKARMTKVYRETVAIIAMSGRGAKPKWKEAEIRLTLRLGRGCKQQDPDNVLSSAKAAIDGLVDAGILAGDRQIRYLPVEQVLDDNNPGLTVEVRA